MNDKTHVTMNETKDNFDADAYFKLYPEIANEYTKETVWGHYIIYGINEKRIFPNKSVIELLDSNMSVSYTHLTLPTKA